MSNKCYYKQYVFHDSSFHVTIVSNSTNHKRYYTNQYSKTQLISEADCILGS
jgi:hypothetical protein